MFVATFVIYFNKKSHKIEALSDYFLKDEVNENGKVERNLLHTMGHEKLYDDLEKQDIPMSDIIMKGILFNQDNHISINSLKLMNYFCMNNNDVLNQANLKNISVVDERLSFSNIVLDFVLGNIEEEKFLPIIRKRIIGVNKFFKNDKKNITSLIIDKDKQK